jgi:outer membrane protein OmpA-like peptidoglycan-associated protein
MTTTTHQYTRTYEDARPGFPKAAVLLTALVFFLLFSLLDITKHGHFSCATIRQAVMAEIENRSHLAEYVQDWAIRGSEPERLESGKVEIVCSQFPRKLTIRGKVVNDSIRAEFSDVAAGSIGADKVDNQLEVLNEDALRELQQLLAAAPTSMHMNYQIKDRGTILLTGDLPNPEMKDQIGRMVEKLRGVRGVINDLGKELLVQRHLILRNVYFDFNKWEIRPESMPTLDEAAQRIEEFLQAEPAGHVRIEGHTDSIANDKYNQWLSEKRAQAVVAAFVSRGLPADRLKPIGKGESRLLVSPDDTPEKRAENRRIEIHFE